MLQYFVDKLFGDLPANFNFVIRKKLEFNNPKKWYYEIYEGLNKNNEEVCIFIYEKKYKEMNSEKRYTNNHLTYSKKLIHPNILKVLHTHENEKRIYIVTEKCIPLHFEGIRSDPIWGIYEIFSAVHFINLCNYVHCLVGPLSVYVNERGRWKLSLFDCIHEKNSSIHAILNDISDHIICNYGYNLNIPNGVHATWIDAHGLALLMTWCYKNYLSRTSHLEDYYDEVIPIRKDDEGGNKSIDKNENFLKTPILNVSEMHNYYDTNIWSMDILKGSDECIPKLLTPLHSMLLKLSNKEVNFLTFLNDESLKGDKTISIMLFLTEMHMKTKIEKTEFLDNLFNNLENISVHVRIEKILPELAQNIEISENRVTCLKIILIICKDISTNYFEKIIYPIVSKYFSLNDRAVRYVLLENFHLIEKHLSSNHINEIYNSYMYGFLDNNAYIKNETIKNFIHVFPKLKSNFKSASLSVLLDNLREKDFCVKTNTIICIAKIAKHILDDKQNILENVYRVGLQDSIIQTRLATIHSIKFTYDQFSPTKYVSNILPLLVKSLIDDSSEVRLSAFDTLESVCSYLRKDLLCSSEVTKVDISNVSREHAILNDSSLPSPEVESPTSYNFLNKIKGMITSKSEIYVGGTSGSSHIQRERCFNIDGLSSRVEMDRMGGEIPTPFVHNMNNVRCGQYENVSGHNVGVHNEGVHNVGVHNVSGHNVSGHNVESTNNNRISGTARSNNTNICFDSLVGVTNNKGNNHTSTYRHVVQKNDLLFKEEMNNNSYDMKRKNSDKVKNAYGNDETASKEDKCILYEQGNYEDQSWSSVNMNRSYEDNKRDNLFSGDFKLRDSVRKTSQKIDIDIDDFFNEFDLKEERSAKVKLNLL
ncbi:protein kinase [Plasmodium gonderi]|uniref:Protein kinase n=1 Tax=Plasmodium gonderi TaxID=77519 RepID=A0A1Y1JG72_PLAGO|nr:protein kinase [Plasmodium gonderi]GAW81519.1 protein kinase [Plasmodium gonderi]